MITVDAKNLVAKLKNAARALDRAAEGEVERVAQEARERIVTRYWKSQTGKTASSTRVEAPGPAWRRVAVRVPWGTYLDRGTRAHRIEPRNGRALGPMRGGATAGKFFRRVNHPGTKGFYFVRKEAERGRTLLARRFVKRVIGLFKLRP